MIATRGQIEKTLASLDMLTSAPPDRLRDAYQQYARDADKIAQQAATVDKESRQMRRRSDAWLAGWQKSQTDVNNPELKALSEKRRAQALERFQNIDGSFAAARALDVTIADLQVLTQTLAPSPVSRR